MGWLAFGFAVVAGGLLLMDESAMRLFTRFIGTLMIVVSIYFILLS